MISPEHPLYDELGCLLLMNLYTGAGDVTMDFDPKHIFKHTSTFLTIPSLSNQIVGLATQLHTADGSLVGGTLITHELLASSLKLLPELVTKDVDILIDPSDHQNVPKAVKLLQCIVELRTATVSGLTPSQCVLEPVKLLVLGMNT